MRSIGGQNHEQIASMWKIYNFFAQDYEIFVFSCSHKSGGLELAKETKKKNAGLIECQWNDFARNIAAEWTVQIKIEP